MLSVLIYRKASQPFLDQYRCLFEPYLESGKIAFCFWDEHGIDYPSALPELEDLVRGIKQWKAIVVLPLEETKDLETRQENPFDYLCNSSKEPKEEESQVPLIRLAQMLGGVPPTEDQQIWEDLNEKYRFKCDLPAALYLLKARENRASMHLETEEQGRRYESDSSRFWYRNRYPAKARFLTQSCTRVGYARYQEDLFRFWMTAFTLALNDLPGGMFEAYKVYETCAKVDEERLNQAFSDYYFRLADVKEGAVKQIAELKEGHPVFRDAEEATVEEVDIPVQLIGTKTDDLLISSQQIGLAGDCPQPEEPWWQEQVRGSMRNLDKMTHATRRELDLACILCRTLSEIRESEVRDMDEYQCAEMAERLSELEMSILTFHTNEILPLRIYRRELQTKSNCVADAMRKRMNRLTTILVGAVGTSLFSISFLPPLVHQWQRGDAFAGMLTVTVAGSILMSAAVLGTLVYFRWGIQRVIHAFNDVMHKLIDDFRNAGTGFSSYLSRCCSYMRGVGKLQALEHRTKLSAVSVQFLSEHVDHLERHMEMIRGWLENFNLKVLPDSGLRQICDFDFEIPPEKNGAYLFQLDRYRLHLTLEDGRIGNAPYPFVTSLGVKRLSFYETRENQEEQG